MTRRDLVSLGALVFLGVVASYLLGDARTLGRDVGNSAVAARLLADRTSPRMASGKADLTVVVFADYRCPACRAAAPALSRAAAEDGNVRIIYRDWPIFGERSVRAAQIALAAHRQGIYLPVHDALMRLRSFDDDEMRAVVEASGGSWRQIQSDMVRHGPAAARMLAQTSEDAFALGLKGTPGYLIGPLLIEGALNEREFLQAFDEVRAE